MEREFDRYVVLKSKDINKYLNTGQQYVLFEFCRLINEGREKDGKREYKCVVVEDDWPEYELVWKMIDENTVHS